MTDTVRHSVLVQDVYTLLNEPNNPAAVTQAVRDAVAEFTEDVDVLRNIQTAEVAEREGSDGRMLAVWEFQHSGFDFGQVIRVWSGTVRGDYRNEISPLVGSRVQIVDASRFWIGVPPGYRGSITCEYSLRVRRDADEFPSYLYNRFKPAMVAKAMTMLSPDAREQARWLEVYDRRRARAVFNLIDKSPQVGGMNAGPVDPPYSLPIS